MNIYLGFKYTKVTIITEYGKEEIYIEEGLYIRTYKKHYRAKTDTSTGNSHPSNKFVKYRNTVTNMESCYCQKV